MSGQAAPVKVAWDVEDDSFLFGNEERTFGQKFKNYIVNDGVKLFFILVVVGANIGLFIYKFMEYYNGRYPDPQNPPAIGAAGSTKLGDAWLLFGPGVGVARGAALVLKLNCAIILIPVLRNVLSFLRGTPLNNVLPLDKNIVFHRYLGWAIVFWSLVHVTAHFFNFNAIQSSGTGRLLSGANPQPFATQVAYTTLPGWTGNVALLCLMLIAASAVERVRRPFFEMFWYTHHLFILFYAMIIAHGFLGLLETPTFWMWVIGPLVLYLLERIIRTARGKVHVIVHEAIMHPSRVLEVKLARKDGKDFRYKSGQYMFLNSPYLATQEWHPFTITSTPQDEFLSFHIREAGDWTGDLINLLVPEGVKGGSLPRLVAEDMHFAPNGQPILRVDGGFGAASEEVFGHNNLMLVGAGIGVTPFASILKNIQYQLGHGVNVGAGRGNESGAPFLPGGTSAVKKVHFFWINRDREAFEWFSALLAELEATNDPEAPWLEINVYLTEKISKEDDLKDFFNAEEGEEDEVTGLHAKTNYGRPSWDAIFLDMATLYHGQKLGVFFCGPKGLSRILYQQCRLHTDAATNTRFEFRKENF